MERDILTHYAITDEGDRLFTRARLEGERTRELLRRFLPPPPAKVLDIGGAEARTHCRWRATDIAST